MVEAQYTHGCCILGNDSNIAVAGERRSLVVGRRLPPVDFAAAQGGHRRERIQYQPLDPIEMRNLRSGRETYGSVGARLIERKALISGAGAADMLVGQEAIGAATDDISDRLERRCRRQPL